MVFSSLIFLFRFLPLMLLIYFLVPKKIKNLSILVLSIVFYAWAEPKYVLLMLFMIIVNFFAGLIIDKENEVAKRKRAAVIAVIINVIVLAIFKYGEIINKLFENLIRNTSLKDEVVIKLMMPVGISFYTFQGISYIVDVYRKNAKAQKNLIDFAMYISMFPQLVAGPIIKYSDVEAYITNRKSSEEKLAEGIKRFVLGLGKKVLLANNFGILWNQAFNELNKMNNSIVLMWLGAIAFTLQIYFDFSGYSDMAIGLGKILGFDFMENFNYPYMAKSVNDFWKRWHISLTNWFREYVYIFVGGNKKGKTRTIINIFIVWMLTGMWHGATINFFMWGVYYGVIIIVERFVLINIFGKDLEKCPFLIKKIVTMILVIVGWVIFAVEDIHKLLNYFAGMLGIGNIALANDYAVYLLYTNLLIIVIGIIGSTDYPKKLVRAFTEKMGSGRLANIFQSLLFNAGLIIVFLLSTAYLVNDSYNPFLYFRF